MSTTAPTTGFDVEHIRGAFPALHQQVHGKRLAFLDTAASAQTCRAALDAMAGYYEHDRANIHRGVYALSERATKAYEAARVATARWINAADPSELVFTRGTTEAINLVAGAWGRRNLFAGDTIVCSALEHHANIVPWQLIARERGFRIRVWPCTDAGELALDALPGLLDHTTRLVAITHVSNALGTVNPIAEVTALAHARGIPVLVDGAQALPHGPVDVQALGTDFYAFSGHKMYGPTGIGGLWARRALLDAMPPWQGGGDMIRTVTFDASTFAPPPARFEAGTPNIAGAIGLGATVEWMATLDWAAVAAHEQALLAEAAERLAAIAGVRLVGTAPHKVGVVSFVLDGVHPHDLGTICDQHGVAIRAGHHCAQPLMERLGLVATARASFGVYNTRADVDQLITAVQAARELFA